VKVNFGSGQYPFMDWTNVDLDPAAPHAVHMDAIAFLNEQADNTVAEIYGGHFFEHLTHEQAQDFLAEAFRVLVPGGRLGLVVPDMREVLARYVMQTDDEAEYPHGKFWPLKDLDAVCGLFLYGTCQDSQHRWSYDGYTLGRALTQAGFVGLREIDRYRDQRVMAGVFWQGGWDGYKPAAEASA
jgi:predicted SAM-dependent methyltransferase